MTEKFTMTCDKDSVYLSRDKANHMYLIEFRSHNPKIRIDALLTFDIYKMMYELNKDLFDSYHIASWDWARDTRTFTRTCRIYCIKIGRMRSFKSAA